MERSFIDFCYNFYDFKVSLIFVAVVVILQKMRKKLLMNDHSFKGEKISFPKFHFRFSFFFSNLCHF